MKKILKIFMMFLICMLFNACSAKTNYEYLLTKQTTYDKNGEISQTTEYTYYEDGRIDTECLKIYQPSSVVEEGKKYGFKTETIELNSKFEYDNDNSYALVYISGNNIDGETIKSLAEYFFDEKGRIIATDDGEWLTTTAYDDNGRIISSVMYENHRGHALDDRISTGSMIMSTTYEYSKDVTKEYVNGNYSGKTEVKKRDKAGNIIQDARFDRDGNVISASEYTYVKKSELFVKKEVEADKVEHNKNATLKTTKAPLIINLYYRIYDAVEGVLSSNSYAGTNYNFKNYTIVSQKDDSRVMDTEFVGFDDYIIAGDYGPEDKFLFNATVNDGIVVGITSMTPGMNSIQGNLLTDHKKLEEYAKMALAPMMVVFDGMNCNKLADDVWGKMVCQFNKTEKISQYLERTSSRYDYLGENIKITLDICYMGGSYNYSVVSAELEIYDSLINDAKNSTEYSNAKNQYEKKEDNDVKNNDYAIKKAREFLASGVGEYPDAVPGGGYIEVREEIPEEWNNYAQYSIVGRGFSPIYDSDCFEFSLETDAFYFNSYGTFYKIVCDDNGIHIYYGDSRDSCNELCGQVIMERYDSDYDDEYISDQTQSSNTSSTPDITTSEQNMPILTKEEENQLMLDKAGILPEFRFDTYTPEIEVSGSMRNGTQFVLDEKIALKGYWDVEQWDILEELYIAPKYNLKQGVKYTIKGKLNYDEFQQLEIIEDASVATDAVTEEVAESYTYYHYKWTGKTTIGTPWRVYSKDKSHRAESTLAAGFTLDNTEPVYEEYVFDTYNGDSFYTTLTADSSGLEEQWFIKK